MSDLWDAPAIVPAITYDDLPRAIEWLERVFGFRERGEARLTWTGGMMAWMEAGEGLFLISTPDETWRQGGDGNGVDFVMKVYVDDVDEHFRCARLGGATILSEPEDGFWGGRIYRAQDHEGHRWEFSQSGRDLAPERWALPPGLTRGKPN